MYMYKQTKEKQNKPHIRKHATWMKITHLGQQLIFYFYVFVEFVFYIFQVYCPFHILEFILFHVFIYFICLIRILFIMLNSYHFRFVYFCYFVVCMYIHEYVKIIVMWVLSFVVVYAGNKMDFTGGKFEPKSASSILQAPSCINQCRFVGGNCVTEVNSWSPEVNPPPKTAGAFTWMVATLLHEILQS